MTGWIVHWTSWCSGRYPSPLNGCWNYIILKVLWFYDSPGNTEKHNLWYIFVWRARSSSYIYVNKTVARFQNSSVDVLSFRKKSLPNAHMDKKVTMRDTYSIVCYSRHLTKWNLVYLDQCLFWYVSFVTDLACCLLLYFIWNNLSFILDDTEIFK